MTAPAAPAAPASFSARRLSEARARITATVAAMATLLPVLFCAVAVYFGQHLMIAAINMACSVVCGGLWWRATRGYRASTDRAIALTIMATLAAVCAVEPQIATVTLFTPVAIFVLCAEPSARWRLGLLAAVCVQIAVALARVGMIEAPGASLAEATQIETVHCLVVGVVTMVMVQIYRRLGARVRATGAAYAKRLRDGVAAASADAEELAEGSAAFAATNAEIAASVELQRGVQAELAATHEQLEQFGNAASHDLKEPIRTIRAFTQLLRREAGALPSGATADAPELTELTEHFDFVDGACVAMQTLLDKLLLYHRTSAAHEGDIACESLCVERVWTAALAAELEGRDDGGEVVADLIVKGDDGSTRVLGPSRAVAAFAVRGHRQHTEAAFREIIHNGLLFHDEDATAVKQLVCEVSAIGKDRVRVAITDNGIGIAEAYREQVFGMFKRLHPREVYPGAGLGLPLVRRVVEGMGGEVRIAAGEEGAGTTVVMELVRASTT